LGDYETVRREVELYDTALAGRPEVIALNKIDVEEARARAEGLQKSFPGDVVLLSGATGEGTRALIQLLLRRLQETAPQASAAIERPLAVLHPRGRDGLEVAERDGVYVISGGKAKQDAIKLGEGGYEALDELQERLRRQGLERVLRRAGARPGARLRVGEVELEWQG
jgi:GTP-binding protein